VKTIPITSDAWDDLARSVPPGTPVLTLNLLRFREHAQYREGSEHPPCAGRTAYYERYAKITVPIAIAGGGKLILSGSAVGHPVCPPDERWDDILMFEYPDIAGLIALGAAPAYQAAAEHRTAALADSRLLIIVRNGSIV